MSGFYLQQKKSVETPEIFQAKKFYLKLCKCLQSEYIYVNLFI